MSESNKHSRREILKKGAEVTAGQAALNGLRTTAGAAATGAATTSLAGCADSGAQEGQSGEDPDGTSKDEDNPDEENSEADSENSASSYEPVIETGEEFHLLPDTRRFVDDGLLLAEAYQAYDDPEERELMEEILGHSVWGIFRTEEAVENMDQETVDYFDENAVPVTGRGFIDANYSDIGAKIEFNLGEMGALDVKGMTPEQIEAALEGNFSKSGNRNGRTIYEGEFTDQRDGSSVYDVIIGHDGNHNLVFASDVPSDRTSVFNEKEGPYKIMEQTVSGDLESVMEGDGHRINRIMEAFDKYFPDDDHGFEAQVLAPDESDTRKGSEEIAKTAMFKWKGDEYRNNQVAIIEGDGEDYGFEKTATVHRPPEKAHPNFNPKIY